MAASVVLLGLADSIISLQDEENVTWQTNKFGGKANWMEECFPDSHPLCDNCQSSLYHVSQIYCPLIGSEYHRTVNIFGCMSIDCQNKASSWKVLRSQCKEKPFVDSANHIAARDDSGSGELSWCQGADDWGEEASNVENVSAMFEDLRVTQATTKNDAENEPPLIDEDVAKSRTQQLQGLSDRVPCFDAYYIHVVDEPRADSDECYKYEQSLLKEYEKREGLLVENLNSLSDNNKEKYEKRHIADGDKDFHRFQKRIKRCPLQCLRYEFNGSPLKFSNIAYLSCQFDDVPVCSNCQSVRVFEMQLMPALSSILRVSEHSSPGKCLQASELGTKNPERHTRIGNMEIGALYVFTCSQSCNRIDSGISKPVDEYIILQCLPDHTHVEKAFNA
eukprot:gene12152-13405_t